MNIEDNSYQLKVGDRVEFLDSVYLEHPSRMTGGTGIIQSISIDEGEFSVAQVLCDNRPADDYNSTWPFFLTDLKPLEI